MVKNHAPVLGQNLPKTAIELEWVHPSFWAIGAYTDQSADLFSNLL